MPDGKWFTAITEVKPNELRPRGYRLDELMGRAQLRRGGLAAADRRAARSRSSAS